jgi:thymidylate synthase
MNALDKQYQTLLQTILDFGVEKKDRTGTGTKSIFGYTIRHNMKDGFPLLTTKKMAWKTMVTELLWFLQGNTNIKYLVDNNCHIWDGDCFANYVRNFPKYVDSLPENSEAEFIINKDKFINKIKTDDEFAKKWGDLGPVYGRQWRGWNNLKWEATDKVDPSHPDRPMLKWKLEGVDQIANLINDLKTNPDSRRLMVNAWNVGELDQMVLPPCHYGFQVYTRELSLEERKVIAKKVLPILNTFLGNQSEEGWIEQCEKLNIPTRAISLMWVQRSVDSALGWPYNVSSYSLLLMMLAKQVNMVPDEVICSLGDCHIYLNHIDGVKEQLTREPYPLPNVRLSERAVNDISEYTLDDIVLENYQSHPKIYFPLSN